MRKQHKRFHGPRREAALRIGRLAQQRERGAPLRAAAARRDRRRVGERVGLEPVARLELAQQLEGGRAARERRGSIDARLVEGRAARERRGSVDATLVEEWRSPRSTPTVLTRWQSPRDTRRGGQSLRGTPSLDPFDGSSLGRWVGQSRRDTPSSQSATALDTLGGSFQRCKKDMFPPRRRLSLGRSHASPSPRHPPFSPRARRATARRRARRR